MQKFIDMTARYAGTCAGCGQWIRRGNRIAFDPRGRKAYHIEHAPAMDPAPVAERQTAAEFDQARLVAAGLGEG